MRKEHLSGVQKVAFETILELHESLTGKRILDVGAGNGLLALALARQGGRVTGLDIVKPSTPVNELDEFVLHNVNLSSFPFPDGNFDIIVSTEVLEHLKAPFPALIEMVRLLKEDGLLILTIPNYWNLRYRVKYLLSGNFQRPLKNDERKRADYLNGSMPHISTITYPTLKTILTWEGCGDFALFAKQRFGWGYRLITLPFYALVRFYSLIVSAGRRERFLLDETNSPMVLLGKGRILVRCKKQAKT